MTDDPMIGTLADGLAAISCDLSPGLQAVFECRGGVLYSVIWQWRFDFFSHWGHHAIDAIQTIHSLIAHHGWSEEDNGEEGAKRSA